MSWSKVSSGCTASWCLAAHHRGELLQVWGLLSMALRAMPNTGHTRALFQVTKLLVTGVWLQTAPSFRSQTKLNRQVPPLVQPFRLPGTILALCC